MNKDYNKDCTEIYILNHILIGFFVGITKYKYILIISIIIYQFIQFIFNVRFFIYYLKIKKGNSLKHTLNKLLQYIIGFIIGLIVKKYSK